MTGAELQAIRERHGWSRSQVATALHYAKTSITAWETGVHPVPAPVAAWAQALPPVRQNKAYPPTSGGFRQWWRKHPFKCREFAEWCGVAEHTVWRWFTYEQSLPLGVRAWLLAGAPPAWRWAPPGLPNMITRRGKNAAAPARLRPQATQRRHPGTLNRQLVAATVAALGSRPRRRRDGTPVPE